MKTTATSSWARFQARYFNFPEIKLSLDLSRMSFDDAYLQNMARPMRRVFSAMRKLEAGAIANPDERRQVGHYWLRDPQRAPTPTIRKAIVDTRESIINFVKNVHSGSIQGQKGKFDQFVVIGIGGSALGPQFVSQALGRTASIAF
jgi:glucose-6-phosphate isomerase